MEKVKVLIVEDEAIIAMEIESSLESLGYAVASVVDTGRTAIQKAEIDEPDIVLMDIRIKGEMDGIEAAGIIQARFGIPVIFSTAYLDEERIGRAKLSTPFGYILKPIQERDLKVTIEMALHVARTEKKRKAAEDDLKASEAQKQAILDGITTNIAFVNQNLEILWANKTAAESVDKTPEELYGRRCYELWADPEKPCENCPTVRAFQTRKSEHSIIHSPDGRIWDEGGEPAFDVQGNLLGVVEIAQDITERKRTEEALKKSEERYRTVVDNAIEAICVIQDGMFEYFNPEAVGLFGYTENELKRLSVEETIFADDKELVTSRRLQRLKGEQVTGIYFHRIVTKDGGIRWVDIKAVTIAWNSRPATLVFIADITERKRSEELMIQTEKMASIGGLAAGVAHELVNPLGGMLQGTQNVLRRLSPDLKSNLESAEEFGIDLHRLQLYLEKRGIFHLLDGIRESGEKAARTIADMQQFSRKGEFNTVPVHLVGMMESALKLAGKDYDMETRYDFQKIEIAREFGSNLPLIPCNKTEIEQVFLNLLIKAARNMADENGGSPRITLRIEVVKEMAQIEVEDRGPGMNEETRKRIFEPFFFDNPGGKETGLGLSVSYMIITHNHKGSMEVESELGKGTRFIIRLPLEREKR
ncbi:MAG: PAS domain S-box protein [Proteobacteria bacterium]|nr:PAS domain S-box protein [Pseudomonadota bacterium]